MSRRCPHEPVQVRRHHTRHDDELLLLPLAQATEWITSASTHTNPLLLSSSLGSSCSTDQLPLYDTLEALFVHSPTDDCDDTMDWLACFGRHTAMHDTLMVLGDGAASRLLSHPYTKLILCLEGRPLLRAVPPHGTNDWNIPTEPIWATAWEGFSWSMGLQLANPSMSLFAYRHHDVDDAGDSNVDDYETLQQWADDPHYFHPNIGLLQSRTQQPQQHDNLGNLIDDSPDPWHSSVLRPGTVAVIPPGWWFQLYNAGDTKSVCLQSQRCGGSPKGIEMVQHILETSLLGKDHDEKLHRLENNDHEHDNGGDVYYTADEAQDLVDELFEILQEHH